MSPRAAWRLESLGFGRVFDYVGGKLDWLSAGLPVEGASAGAPSLGTVARRDVPTCRLEERLDVVRERMGAGPSMPCVVVNEQRIVLGLLKASALEGDPSRTVEEVMRSGPSTFRPNVSLREIDQYLHDHELDFALVTTSDGELVGLASADDVRRAMDHPGR
jgi:CBS domain-containing protein